MRSPLATAIAIAVGLIVLFGYFIPLPFLQTIRTALLGWAVTLAGVAALVAVIGLLSSHWRKLRSKTDRDFYSPVLILAFLLTFAAGVVLTPADPRFQKVVTAIQAPVEISLMAVVAVVLSLAGLRLIQRRKGGMAIVFLASAILFLLLGSGWLPAGMPGTLYGSVLGFIQSLPLAGARGILLGVALGSLVAGLRILLGTDRPYSG